MSSGLSPVVCFLDEKLLPFFLRLWKQKSRDYLKNKTRQKTKELNHLALDVGRSRSDSMLPQRDPRKNIYIQDSTVLSKFLLMCSDSGFSCIERPGNSSTDDGSVCYKPVTHATRQHADFSYIKFISELCLFFTHSAYNKRRAIRVIVLAWTCRENVAIFSFNSDILMAVSSNKGINDPPVMYQCILLKCTGLK